MSIVFEEVTGSVGPEVPAAPEAAARPNPADDSPELRADQLRLALALMAERELRLRAD